MVALFSRVSSSLRLQAVKLRSHAARPTPIEPPPLPVDIIVPVYRGLEDTRQCIDSVLASPVRSAFRLVVINDASPEPELTAWLRHRAGDDSRMVLLENAENLGFVQTVNRGMSLDERRDVLLLNSDTEVANDWLDRLRAAAYGDARVATVTPFSSNATICSYPRFCENNRLPAGYDTARIDALCARANSGEVVDIPTGVGFCMYIRRDSLRELGLFDTENFGKGYGEENDFCQRAARAGWRNLHLLDTFVLHTGGVSFGSSKGPREDEAMRTLLRLHPKYERDIDTFVRADPSRAARSAMDITRIRECRVPVILSVLHSRRGGTDRHVRELARQFTGRAIFLLLTPTKRRRALLRLADEGEKFELGFRLPEEFPALVCVLRAMGVGHIHFHHLLGHAPVIRELPQRLGVTHDFTAHDYYSYCTYITLTGVNGVYLEESVPGQCGCCPPGASGPEGMGTVAQWRAANAGLLSTARRVFAPSRDAAARIEAFVPGSQVLAVGHTDLPPAAQLPQPMPAAISPDKALKVVVLGALSAIKGAELLEAIALAAARHDAPLEFHLLGYGHRPLQTEPRSRLRVYGEYQDEELAKLLAELAPDLAWFPAKWPETYSYTLSAILAAGLPVVVPDIGAFPERVAGRSWSWIRPWNATPAEWLEDFISMRDRHFLTGNPPTLEESQARFNVVVLAPEHGWSYDQDYLAGLPASIEGGPLPRAMDLQPFVAREEATAKLRMLAALTYLRMHPRLRGLACKIPAHWRERVSSWLSA